MLSLEKEHPAYAESCHCLQPDQSAYSLRAEIRLMSTGTATAGMSTGRTRRTGRLDVT